MSIQHLKQKCTKWTNLCTHAGKHGNSEDCVDFDMMSYLNHSSTSEYRYMSRKLVEATRG